MPRPDPRSPAGSPGPGGKRPRFDMVPLSAFVGAFLSIASAGASAANWVPVTSHSRGTIFVDTDSVRRSGNEVLVSIELKLAQVDARGVAYEVDQWDFDCDRMTVATLTTQQFASGGQPLGPQPLPSYYPERLAISPDSAGFDVYKVVCR
jgi:hypothetical protein